MNTEKSVQSFGRPRSVHGPDKDGKRRALAISRTLYWHRNQILAAHTCNQWIQSTANHQHLASVEQLGVRVYTCLHTIPFPLNMLAYYTNKCMRSLCVCVCDWKFLQCRCHFVNATLAFIHQFIWLSYYVNMWLIRTCLSHWPLL